MRQSAGLSLMNATSHMVSVRETALVRSPTAYGLTHLARLMSWQSLPGPDDQQVECTSVVEKQQTAGVVRDGGGGKTRGCQRGGVLHRGDGG